MSFNPDLDTDLEEVECLHDDIRVETDEGYDGHQFSYYVCNLCGEDVAGDPDADAYDAMVDMQIDEARGK